MGLLALGLWTSQASAQIPKIIFDTDMSSDHDDAADIAVLHGLADLGECEIIACMADSQNGGTALALNSINTYYGRPNIPCGRRPDTGGPGAYPAQIASEYPHPLYATYTDPPLAANLYRQVLAAQPDHSVTIVTAGYLNNLQALMQSGPDSYSSLNGMDLIRQKVKLWSCAGGNYPSGDEFNFRVEGAAANYVVNNWPVAAFFDGYDIGQDIYSGGGLQSTPQNPIRRAFELSFFGPYPTWTQIMIYYAVRSNERVLWNYNTTGHNTCFDNGDGNPGHNAWVASPDPSGDQEQGYLIEKQRFPIQETLETLVMNAGWPASKGTTHAPNQPTHIRATVASGTQINLQWSDNSWNETGFAIERRIGGGAFTPITTVGANVTTYSDTGLPTTANVGYRIKANNSIGSSAYTTKTVYSGGWTETNLTNPSDHSTIYNVYQFDNLTWARGAAVVGNVAVNNDSTTNQDVTINVQLGAMGAYGRYFVYFLYQDQNNWYRVNTGSSGQGASNYTTRFEKCVGGTITQLATVNEGINMGNGALMQTWQVVVSHTGSMQFFTNNNPSGNGFTGPDNSPVMHSVLSATDTFSFATGKIALGSDIGQPVWNHFSFDTTATGTAPSAPTGLGATAGSAQVVLNWAASSGATSYNVYRGTTSGGESTTPIVTGLTSATYTNTGLTNGTTYYYKVRAVNSSGTSGDSNEASATPTAGGSAPAAPTSLSATAGNAQISLGWTASSGASSYNVYRGTTAGGESPTPIVTGVTGTTYTNTGLTNGTAYYYKVAAVNSFGTSGYSNESNATPAAGGGGTGTSIGVQFVGSGTALAVADSAGVPAVAQDHWKVLTGSSFSNAALTDNSGGSVTATLSGSAAGIYVGGGTFTGGNQKLAGGELFNPDITTVTNSITLASIPYATYDVYVYGACDAGGRNATFTVTPSGGAASSKSFQTQNAASTWTEGTNTWNGSGTAPTLSPGNYVRFAGLTASSFSLKFGGVGNVGMNGIQIVSVSGGGSAPAAPTGLSATAGNAQVNLSWTASSGATSYNIYRGTTAGGESTTPVVTGVTGTTYSNTGLTNGTTYYYKVKAVNVSGTSGYSNEANATPVAGGSAPAAPTGLGATAGNAQVSLSWTASSGATSYNVYRGTAAGGESTTPVVTGLTGTTYVNTGLTNGTAYYYKVAAVNSFGTSAYSNEASATPSAGGSGSQLTGTVIGTTGSYGGSQWTVDKVFDNDLNTFFDANVGSGAWAGLDLGTAKVITQIKFCPRTGWASRMTGGIFQGSNTADFSTAVTLFTVSGSPTEGVLTAQTISNGTAFRYVRYLSAPNGWCNIAEVQFFGN